MRYIYILSILFFASFTNIYGQTNQIANLEKEIEDLELRITDIERKIAKNSSSSNASANAALEKEIKDIEQQIYLKIKEIERIQKSANASDDEIELMKLQEKLNDAEQIIEQLEQELLDLQKENQQLLTQGGGFAQKEKMERKIDKLEQENQLLKSKVKVLQKNGGTLNNTSGNYALDEFHFLRQFRNKALTNWVIGYGYTFNQRINIEAYDIILNNWEPSGSYLNDKKISMPGHRLTTGMEFVFHWKNVGINLGILGEYAMHDKDSSNFNYGSGQLKMEITIMPLRLGLIASGQVGYCWGELADINYIVGGNVQAQSSSFSTLFSGWDVGARLYLSRLLAFKFLMGADRAIDDEFKDRSFDTQLRYTVGLDFLIPITPRSKRTNLY